MRDVNNRQSLAELQSGGPASKQSMHHHVCRHAARRSISPTSTRHQSARPTRRATSTSCCLGNRQPDSQVFIQWNVRTATASIPPAALNPPSTAIRAMARNPGLPSQRYFSATVSARKATAPDISSGQTPKPALAIRSAWGRAHDAAAIQFDVPSSALICARNDFSLTCLFAPPPILTDQPKPSPATNMQNQRPIERPRCAK